MSNPRTDALAAPELAAVQRLFWHIITHPTGARDFVERSDTATRRQIELLFDDSPAFPRIERLEVYAQAYFFRLLDTLAELFPITRWRLSTDVFHNLVTDYVLANPSTNPDLAHLGDALPAYLSQHMLSMPVLSDLARVEREIRTALDAPDGAPLHTVELAAVVPEAWPALRFRAAPHVRLVDVQADYAALKSAKESGIDPKTLSSDFGWLNTTRRTLVWRSEYRVWTRQLHAPEQLLLEHVLGGASFEDVCELAARLGLTPHDVVTYSKRWVTDGLLERSDR